MMYRGSGKPETVIGGPDININESQNSRAGTLGSLQLSQKANNYAELGRSVAFTGVVCYMLAVILHQTG